MYPCKACAGCALAGDCRDSKAKRGRTGDRDGHEPLREKMPAKMQTDQGKDVYNRRMHIGETPFAIIKNIFGVRRFLLRGLEKVRTEWRWVCTAYNMRKLMHAWRDCAELAKMNDAAIVSDTEGILEKITGDSRVDSCCRSVNQQTASPVAA